MSSDNGSNLYKFRTVSGFTLEVKPLPPYYLDPINEAFPLKEMPKRKVRLAAGDVHEYAYEMPEEEPDPSDEEEHDLWMRAKYVLEFNAEQERKRNKAKRDFLLSMCIRILDGPESPDDNEWVSELQAVDPELVTVPTHRGARRLLFIKLRVLTVMDEVELVMDTATYQEVSEQGIASALHGFRSDLARHTSAAGNKQRQSEESP